MTETLEITPTEDWTDEQIAARADTPMPDVPVLPGIGDVAQSVPAAEMSIAAAAAPAQGTGAAMIAEAQGLVGVHEQPMGSNHAPPVTTWYGFDASWCDMSISYEAAHSGNAGAVGRFAYCPSHTRWFDARGEWAYGGSDLRPGDVVFFEWTGRRTRDADHVGLVEHVFPDGSFYSLEGNHADQFMRVHRDRTYVAGRGRPKYPNGSGGSGSSDTWPGRYLRYVKGASMMTGSDVRWVQEHLNKHGHKVAEDGVYGPNTAAAVVAFQRERNLMQDGVVGEKTWGALRG